MKSSRLSNKSHWTSVGRRAKSLGLSLEAVLTKSAAANEWIREGYSA